jgi:hypothetical protein
MSGPHRNPDKLNTIGVVVVGICGAVLVYVTILALQAFYVSDTAELQTAQDYGNQDAKLRSIRAEQQRNIKDYALASPTTYHIDIEVAMDKVVHDAQAFPSALVPSLGKSIVPTICPEFGRPKKLTDCGRALGSAATPAPTPPAQGSNAGSDADEGSADAGGNAP